MPIILLVAGALLLVSAIRGTTNTLGKQLSQDFTGQNSFLYWLVAIVVIGSIGYVDRFKEVSRAFLALVLLAMVLANGTGVFARLSQAIANPATPANPTDGTTPATNSQAAASPPGSIPAQANANANAWTGSQQGDQIASVGLGIARSVF